ncbi:hypothetical protein JCM24511_00158 [Saitozyma sp. JCM 24511]|nr:hypothetical protein JCM24511_00158 [Saitozyma sp. JCM 24511]
MAQETLSKAPKTGGDDLDDGLELDPELLASDAEDDGEVDVDEDDGEEGVYEGDDLSGHEDGEREKATGVGKKRKAEADDQREQGETEHVDEEARMADKKRRKKEKEKARKAKRLQNQPTAPSTTPTHLTPSDLSSLLLASIRESFPSATPMEISDLLPSESSLLPPADFPVGDEPEGSFAPVQRRIEAILQSGPKLKVAAPRVIVLALSGLRCADVVRGVRDVKGNGQVAKLFAKHMKYPEQVKFLANNKVSIAVGTPARVGKLLSEDAITVNKDTVLLLDIGHRDSKTRTLLTLPEIRDELWKSVFSGTARERLLSGGARIGAF